MHAQTADAGADKTICSAGGPGVTIGNMTDDPKLCYSWKASPDDPSMTVKNTAKINVNPTRTTTYTLTVIGQDFSTSTKDEVKVFVVDEVLFSEVAAQKYGYDDHTDAIIPWKSVEKGASDEVAVKITPADGYEGVYFKSATPGNVTVSPNKASAAQFNLTLNGVANGEAEIQANCGKEDGDNIKKINTKTFTLKARTVAVRLVHAKNYQSTNASDADILSFLNNKCYNQSVLKWTLVRLPAKTVDFDLDGNGKLDVERWMSDEMKVIRDNCKDDSYDMNVFLVDNPSDASYGFSDFNQRYAYVHGNTSPNVPTTVAHELGHGAFGLTHESGDGLPINLMTQGAQVKYRLFKPQWDKIN